MESAFTGDLRAKLMHSPFVIFDSIGDVFKYPDVVIYGQGWIRDWINDQWPKA